MPQSNVIFAFIFAAFLVFITARGDLPKYGKVFFGSSSAGGKGAGGAPAGGDAAKGTQPTNAPAADAKDALKSAPGVAKRLDEIKNGLAFFGVDSPGLNTGIEGVRRLESAGNWMLDTIDGVK